MEKIVIPMIGITIPKIFLILLLIWNIICIILFLKYIIEEINFKNVILVILSVLFMFVIFSFKVF